MSRGDGDGTPPPGRATVRWIDERAGASPALKAALRYVFPEHWSFMLGEIALYAFLVLIATGTFLALFFQSSTAETTYHGSYAPLAGERMSLAYASTLRLSQDVPAGLLLRQTHHWAALVFVAAIVAHLLRVFFTGAFRKPRDLTWAVGVTLLMLAVLEGFAGYSLPDDLLSGMGLAIAYGVAMSIPVVGGNVAFLAWDGEYPGGHEFLTRLLTLHVFVLPALIGLLIAVHLAGVIRTHHAQFPGPGRTERNVVGAPLWPAYALRSAGLLCATAAVLLLLGGLVQVNPIWQWGPYEPYLGTNGAQPDWYLGWLIGGLRIMPALEIHFWGRTWVPNPFWAGAAFPLVVFATLYAIPRLDRRLTRDRARHELLDRPRDNPQRTALGTAFFAWVALVFFAGSADRVLIGFGIPYESQIWFARAAVFVVPAIAYLVTLRICRELARADAHPLRPTGVRRIRRTPAGGFAVVEADAAGTPDDTG
jgi:ubiquinol-cytochrome c reductase cytochrome b subunit